jgi:hypothetical protein
MFWPSDLFDPPSWPDGLSDLSLFQKALKNIGMVHHYHWDPLSYMYTCKIIKKSTHTLGQFWNSLSTSWRSDPCGILELLASLGSKYATSTPAKNMYDARNSKWNTVSSLLLLSHISDLTILNMWDSLLLSSTCSLVIVVYESSFKLKESATKTNICRRRVTQGYTGIGVDSYLVLDTLEESCLATTLLQKTRTHTFLLRFHFIFHVYGQRSFPLPNVAGHRSTHHHCVRPHKSVRQQIGQHNTLIPR